MKNAGKDTKSVEQLKEIREKISFEIKNMNSMELKKYVEEKLKLHPIAVRKNSGI